MERLATHAAELYAAGVPVVLAGDYNVVPTGRGYLSDEILCEERPRAAGKPRPLSPHSRPGLGRRHPHPASRCADVYVLGLLAEPLAAGCRASHRSSAAERGAAKRLVDAGVDREIRGRTAPAIMLRPGSFCGRSRRGRRQGPRDIAARSAQPGKAAHARRPLLVIDGDSFAHRAYHALPENDPGTRRQAGRRHPGLCQFAAAALSGGAAACCARRLGHAGSAHLSAQEISAPIRAGANLTTRCLSSSMCCRNSSRHADFANAKAPGYEADDFLAAAVAARRAAGGTALVASGDRDTFQLASDRTTILYPVRAGEMARIGPAEVRTRYGVDPEQVPDFIALRGDPSDKLPGAPGVGPTGAADLLRKHGTLEKVLAAGRFPAQAERLRLFRSIATMDPKAPLPRLADQKPTWRKAAALVRAWELGQLADRLEELEPPNRAAVLGFRQKGAIASRRGPPASRPCSSATSRKR